MLRLIRSPLINRDLDYQSSMAGWVQRGLTARSGGWRRAAELIAQQNRQDSSDSSFQAPAAPRNQQIRQNTSEITLPSTKLDPKTAKSELLCRFGRKVG